MTPKTQHSLGGEQEGDTPSLSAIEAIRSPEFNTNFFKLKSTLARRKLDFK